MKGKEKKSAPSRWGFSRWLSFGARRAQSAEVEAVGAESSPAAPAGESAAQPPGGLRAGMEASPQEGPPTVMLDAADLEVVHEILAEHGQPLPRRAPAPAAPAALGGSGVIAEARKRAALSTLRKLVQADAAQRLVRGDTAIDDDAERASLATIDLSDVVLQEIGDEVRVVADSDVAEEEIDGPDSMDDVDPNPDHSDREAQDIEEELQTIIEQRSVLFERMRRNGQLPPRMLEVLSALEATPAAVRRKRSESAQAQRGEQGAPAARASSRLEVAKAPPPERRRSTPPPAPPAERRRSTPPPVPSARRRSTPPPAPPVASRRTATASSSTAAGESEKQPRRRVPSSAAAVEKVEAQAESPSRTRRESEAPAVAAGNAAPANKAALAAGAEVRADASTPLPVGVEEPLELDSELEQDRAAARQKVAELARMEQAGSGATSVEMKAGSGDSSGALFGALGALVSAAEVPALLRGDAAKGNGRGSRRREHLDPAETTVPGLRLSLVTVVVLIVVAALVALFPAQWLP